MRTTILFMLLIVSFPLLATATEPAAQSPELRVLGQRVGAWNVAADFKPAEWTPDGERFKETKTTEWILNGQFLQETVLSDKHEARVLFSYDKTRNVYRSWYFRDNGVTDDWTGTWDEQNTTMTWKSSQKDLDAIATERFVSPDNYEFTLVIKDKNGKLLMHGRAEHARVKK